MQMPGAFPGRRTEVVSRAPSAASTRGARTRPAAPATDRLARKRRRVWMIGIGNLLFWRSRLQLAFELVQEAPIGVFGDDLLRRRFDKAHIAQAQRIEADRVLGIVFPPSVVRDVTERLQSILVTRRETPIDQQSRDVRRIAGAEVCRLEEGAQRALGGDWVVADVFRIGALHATKVLGP